MLAWFRSSLFPALILCLAAFSAAPAYAASVTYFGLDEADGLTLDLTRSGNGVVGRISAPDGSGQEVVGTLSNAQFETDLVFRGVRGRAIFKSQPIGLSVTWRPLTPGAALETVFAFRRESLELPRPPAGYVPPPALGERAATAMAFLNSYEFWPADDVAKGFDALKSRHRGLIALFPAIQTDIAWKLCQSITPSQQLARMLRGQGATCAEIDTAIKNAQRDNRFAAYKARVASERLDALRATECAYGINSSSVCAASAKRTQAAMMTLDTISSLLSEL